MANENIFAAEKFSSIVDQGKDSIFSPQTSNLSPLIAPAADL
jgi:hypothetical protein